MTSPARSTKTEGELAGVFGKGLGDAQTDIAASELDADLGTDAELAVHAAADLSTSVHGALKVSLAAGTAAATDVPVTGMVAADTLVSVLSFATAAAIATVADRTAEYTSQAGGLDKAAGTNETNNQLIIIWYDNAA